MTAAATLMRRGGFALEQAIHGRIEQVTGPCPETARRDAVPSPPPSGLCASRDCVAGVGCVRLPWHVVMHAVIQVRRSTSCNFVSQKKNLLWRTGAP